MNIEDQFVIAKLFVSIEFHKQNLNCMTQIQNWYPSLSRMHYFKNKK